MPNYDERLKGDFFDLVIIGGGSAGLGTAVEAASRGLKVALLEAEDFGAETSGRSTKLLHGGVRYLEQLIKTLFFKGRWDATLFKLIKESLAERQIILNIAPHLAKPLPIVIPLYSTWQVPYYLTGLKLYDLLAGKQNSLPRSRFVSKKELIRRYPKINSQGLKGGIEYHDGQFNDSRMAIALALTAKKNGTVLANHTRVLSLLKDEQGIVTGVVAENQLTKETLSVRSRIIINATGPFSDTIRLMDNPEATPLVTTSSGTHIILPSHYIPQEGGILIPKTEDGRVLFILPWEGYTLVGTTDDRAPLSSNPQPTEQEVDYLLSHIAPYYTSPPTKKEVLAQWKGLRPLLSSPQKDSTAELLRDHVIEVSPSRLITLAGGKWTNYRKMALEVVEKALEVTGLESQFPNQHTENLVLAGGEGHFPSLASELQKKYNLTPTLATKLAHRYGTRAKEVLSIEGGQYNKPLLEGFPYLEAEVFYGCRVEGACTAEDILSRRLQLTLLDKQAAERALARVQELMNSYLIGSQN